MVRTVLRLHEHLLFDIRWRILQHKVDSVLKQFQMDECEKQANDKKQTKDKKSK